VTGREPNKSTEAIREMIDHRLKSISASATIALPPESHLDEDTISAFVEGRLSAIESKPVLSHLTACGSCRRASAQILQLDEIAPDPVSQPAEETPGRIRDFLSNLPSLVSSSDEEVVFAYQNPASEEEPKHTGDPDAGSDESTAKE
jgi:bacterioferritin-associated ferredoxin